MTPLQFWEQHIKTFLKAIEQIGGEVDGVLIKPPCDIQTLKKVEEQLGMRLPDSLRFIVTDFTAGIEMSWSLPDGDELILVV